MARKCTDFAKDCCIVSRTIQQRNALGFRHSGPADSRNYLLENNAAFTCSCTGDRFPDLKTMVHQQHTRDIAGEWRGLYNEDTHEVFIYAYDLQKGVGKK